MNRTAHIQPAELEARLRAFGGPLATATVEPTQVLAPWIVKISGGSTIHGEHFYWATEFNIREIGDERDIVALAGMLLQSFKKADNGIPRGSN